MPFSLYKKKYSLPNYPTFILKRLLRLEPGYFATIAASIGITYVFFHTLPDLQRLLLHIGYLNDIFNHTWLVGIFWTLAIEFQFYFFLGLAYKFVTTKNDYVFSLFAAALTTAALLLPKLQILPRYLGLFLVGMLVFRFMILKINRYLFLLSMIVALCLVARVNGVPEAISALLAAMGILYLRVSDKGVLNKAMLWLGAVSYSIYLVHWPFGIAAVKQLRFVPFVKNHEWLRVAIGLAFTLFCSYLFYLLIEKPSMRWSNRIRYKHEKIPGEPTPGKRPAWIVSTPEPKENYTK